MGTDVMLHHLENSEKKHILQFIPPTHTLSLPVVRSGIELMGSPGKTGVFMAAADRSEAAIICHHQLSLNDVCHYNAVYTRMCVHVGMRDTHAG